MNNYRVPLLTTIHLLALILTIFTLMVIYNYFDTGRNAGFSSIMFILTLSVWSLILLTYRKSEEKIKNITRSVFGEDTNNIVSIYNSVSGSFFGINNKTGEILLIALNRKGRKVFGFDYNTWAGYELEGHKLTLKFNDLDMPYFTIQDTTIPKFKHKLDVLLSASFQQKVKLGSNFSAFVQQKALTA
ncbi:hypothetical protein [Photorhabdus sp. RM71S]|uniref:hypothetical protein n=1 Tax=Photorhabdus sp. RM71S TaxID=3342824 RepID=UPI0036DB3EBB